MSSSLHEFGSSDEERQYILSRAAQLRLDPQAVLAVAAHEGITLPSQVGDSGHSFGPWQLNYRGRLPPTIWQQGPAFAERWANAQEGIDYALQGIATVAAGQRGPTAIRSIVYGFEQPLASLRAGETAASIATYTAGGGPSNAGFGTLSKLPGAHGDPYGGIPGGGAAKSVIGTVSSVEDALKFVTSWRFAEVLGGSLLILLGLLLLGRHFGAPTPKVPGAGLFTSSSSSSPPPAERRPTRRARPTYEGFEPESSRRDAQTARRNRIAARAATTDYGDVPY